MQPATSNTSPSNVAKRQANDKTDDSSEHEMNRKRNEPPTFSSKIKDILEWRTMKVGNGVHQPGRQRENGNAGGDHESAKTKKTKKAVGGMPDLWKSRHIEYSRNKGPKPGQMYEVVNRHIIEDSIDRTVTISTWREQAEEGNGSDTDTMSIYYISPGGYAHEGEHAADVNAKLKRRLLGSKNGSRTENQGTSYGRVEADTDSSSTLAKVRVSIQLWYLDRIGH